MQKQLSVVVLLLAALCATVQTVADTTIAEGKVVVCTYTSGIRHLLLRCDTTTLTHQLERIADAPQEQRQKEVEYYYNKLKEPE